MYCRGRTKRDRNWPPRLGEEGETPHFVGWGESTRRSEESEPLWRLVHDDLGNSDTFGCGGKLLGGSWCYLGNVTRLVRCGGFLWVYFPGSGVESLVNLSITFDFVALSWLCYLFVLCCGPRLLLSIPEGIFVRMHEY